MSLHEQETHDELPPIIAHQIAVDALIESFTEDGDVLRIEKDVNKFTNLLLERARALLEEKRTAREGN